LTANRSGIFSRVSHPKSLNTADPHAYKEFMMEDFLAHSSASYSPRAAQVMMTLSGIAYVDDTVQSQGAIEQQIVTQLADPSYATLAKWSLVWGPVLFGGTDNLCYVAQYQPESGNAPVYAIILRGTAPDFASAWEDIPTSQADFSTFAGPGAQVSAPFRHALIGITSAIDPSQNSTLLQFLSAAIGSTRGASLFVTGHSQGGGLTPMMLAWLATSAQAFAPNLIGYSFAGPTAGNPAFASWVDKSGLLSRVVNPLDVVPFGYAAIDRIIPDDIPCHVTDRFEKICLEEALRAIAKMLSWVGPWQQPSGLQVLPRQPATGDLLAQIEMQHHCNTYLKLLGAPPINI
jgi:hypothetical protein